MYRKPYMQMLVYVAFNTNFSSRTRSIASKMLLYIIIFLQQFQGVQSTVSCIGESGQQVDWFVAYKLPKLESARGYVSQGIGYVYMDGETKNFTMSDKPINSSTSAIGHTLQQIYRQRSLGYIMYNDEDAAEIDSLYGLYKDQESQLPAQILQLDKGHKTDYWGHTKGDLAFDSTSGFWLIHSVPKFPPFAKDSYDYPETGERYGQSFICVTFNYSTFNEIGVQLLYNGPQIYDHYLPDNLASGVPNIQKAIEGKYYYTKPYAHVTKLQSTGSITYTSFAKSKYFGGDLYSNLVAPHYDTDLLVETWQNGEGKLPSNCSELTIENVGNMNLAQNPFKETEDHSKWTISKFEDDALVCIGDINRMESQFKRGGGTLCTKNVNVWNAFRKAITSFQSCENSFDFNVV